MARELRCWNCGESIADIPLPISRHANCGKCFEVLHNCRMCSHYQPQGTFQCDHERAGADPPVIKESANFCDYFKPSPNSFARGTQKKQVSARSDLDALFGDGETIEDDDTEKDDGDVRSRLDDLFDS